MTTAIKTLKIELSANSPFSAYGRRTYPQQYTSVPASTYPTEIAPIMTALAEALGQPTDSTPLTIVSQDSYAQRIVGPKVFKKDNELVLMYDRELIPVDVAHDPEEGVTYKVGKAKATLVLGKNPSLMLNLKGGLKFEAPFRTVYSDVPNNNIGDEIDAGNYTNVAEPSTGGGGYFSALKNLPIGKYLITKTLLNSTGRFGPKIKITIRVAEAQTVVCSVGTDGVWTQSEVEVPAGALITVDSNTSLMRTLQGLELSESDNVFLDVVSKREDELDGKIYVTVGVDFDSSEKYKIAF